MYKETKFGTPYMDNAEAEMIKSGFRGKLHYNHARAITLPGSYISCRDSIPHLLVWTLNPKLQTLNPKGVRCIEARYV